MSTEKKVEEKPTEEEQQEKYRRDFEELPLQKKIASLLELESIVLSETLSFIVNSPSKLVSMAMDVLAEMGLKMEDEAKKQARPTEHQNADGEPSVTEETIHSEVASEPSVKEESHAADVPSVKDESAEKNAEPSVADQTVESEPPPPSVLDEKN